MNDNSIVLTVGLLAVSVILVMLALLFYQIGVPDQARYALTLSTICAILAIGMWYFGGNDGNTNL